MKVEQIAIEDITPYERNAKKHPEEQVEHIANSIREFGFRQPLVIDKDNVLVIGHGRLLAAEKLGMTEVPCIRIDDLSEEQIKALRLADNKTNESDWDYLALDLELDELNLDMEQFGFVHIQPFDDSVLDDLFADAEPKEKEPKTVKCPHCGEVFEI